MEHGTNTAFVGIQLGRALGLRADGLEAVFYGALLKDVGCGACGAVLAPFFADDARTPLLGMNLVDLHSPRSMAGWAMDGLRLDPSLPSRLTRWPPSSPGAARWRTRRWRHTVRSPPTSRSALGSVLTCSPPYMTSMSGTTAAAQLSTGVQKRSPGRPRSCMWHWPPTSCVD